jgi:hypothetical protein
MQQVPLSAGYAGTLEVLNAVDCIQECEARGSQAFWNAAQHNAPSVALAKRMGFQMEKPFRVLAWSRTK